jgi:hypothetical protein
MGKIIQAECDCGFKSKKIFAGCGFILSGLTAPALCTNCYTFTIRNYFQKYNYCSKCRSKVTFYNDKKLWKNKNVSQDEYDSIFWWNIDMFSDEAFVLPNTLYLCPKCREYKMQFYSCGNWD